MIGSGASRKSNERLLEGHFARYRNGPILNVGFLLLLYIDKKLYQDGLISLEYIRTRLIVTLVFISVLAISGIYS